ncbi:SPK domain-containing protein [Caenorhabditis elegans]|uniref:SPK domain-containing protein n=1 Tax=Caenorhabditis elegans TaxID=6239 RepID=Q9NA84_CAEEL|nr:SPK domain-containing protein [Caenorhabditis elegans]CAB55013.2 SPK domain-containing protein [Caenorhabditis elegans]|eukprot:NP_496588.2 Uncharacterized protein CELE_Y57A10A.8 [Caenorhabditis elegans]
MNADTADEEITKLLEFLIEQTKDAFEPMRALAVFESFGQLEEDPLDRKTYHYRFHQKIAPNMDSWNNYSIESRIRLMFALAGRVRDNFLESIQSQGTVELDEKNRICEYISNDGTLTLKGDHSDSARWARRITSTTNPTKSAAFAEKFMNFLVEKTKNVVEPVSVGGIYEEFSQIDGFGLSPAAYRTRFHINIVPEINEWNSYSIEERIRLLMALGALVPEDFLERIEAEGTVDLDEKGRILKYSSNDGNLNLDKRNIATANRRNSTAAHRKRSLDRDSESGSAKNARAVKSEPKSKPQSDLHYSSESDTDDVEFVESLPGKPKLEPIDYDYDQYFNRDVSYNNYDQEEVENRNVRLSIASSMPSLESNVIKLNDFLKEVRKFLCFLEISELDELKHQIKESVVQTAGANENLEISDLCTLLDAFFFSINQKTRSTIPNDSTMPVNVFLIKFKCFLLGMESPEFLDLQEKVQRKLDESDITEKILQLSDIQHAVQYLFFSVSH